MTLENEEKQLMLWPQESLLKAVNDGTKLYVYPADWLMHLNIVSYGNNFEEAQENLKEVISHAPDYFGLGLMRSHLYSWAIQHKPVEYVFEDIKRMFEAGDAFIRVGNTVYGAKDKSGEEKHD